jgi:hypothetical protein
MLPRDHDLRELFGRVELTESTGYATLHRIGIHRAAIEATRGHARKAAESTSPIARNARSPQTSSSRVVVAVMRHLHMGGSNEASA